MCLANTLAVPTNLVVLCLRHLEQDEEDNKRFLFRHSRGSGRAPQEAEVDHEQIL